VTQAGRPASKEERMRKFSRLSLALGAVPFLMLVFALPLANRLKPRVLGFPFILFWILLWIVLTPVLLFAADRLERKRGGQSGEKKP
jgi:hypothetical protein